ncbi:MAG: serpin family protein [Dehalococcoidia bacterium]|nr:serpin family protein [Dehalococcoidia bacterium]
MKKLTAILGVFLILSSFLFPLSGCSIDAGKAPARIVVPAEAADLMLGIKPNRVDVTIDISENSLAAIDFTVKLFQKSVSSKENSMISPLSVLCALAMVANGADGNTRTQMESTLGFSVEDLNLYIYAYMQSIASESDVIFNIANSIWFKDDALAVEREFLQLNADYYGAAINKAPFDDSTLKAINDWVNDNTNGMIKEILDGIPDDVVMYLVNAIVFDAEWQEKYNEDQVRLGTFTSITGAKRDVQMMYSTEGIYLYDGHATGFMKYYEGGRYAFAALLPNKGMSLDNYIKTLSGQGLYNTISNARYTTVYTSLPKFESEYDIEMCDILRSMGMRDAFGPGANFSKIDPSTGLCISSVKHKTFISVDERGTQAAAVTIIDMRTTSSGGPPAVYLDRPFVYMIIDCETNLPIFIGTVVDL